MKSAENLREIVICNSCRDREILLFHTCICEKYHFQSWCWHYISWSLFRCLYLEIYIYQIVKSAICGMKMWNALYISCELVTPILTPTKNFERPICDLHLWPGNVHNIFPLWIVFEPHKKLILEIDTKWQNGHNTLNDLWPWPLTWKCFIRDTSLKGCIELHVPHVKQILE